MILIDTGEETEERQDHFTISDFIETLKKQAENLHVIIIRINQELKIDYKTICYEYIESEVYDIWHSFLVSKGVEIRTQKKILRDEGFTKEDEEKMNALAWQD